LSQVIATFEDGVGVYFARQLISERLDTVELPADIAPPQMGPVTAGLGEIFHYLVRGTGATPPTLMELTTIHDWVIRPQLRTVAGVAEVNTWGGERKQYQVLVDPTRLVKHNLTFGDLLEALRHNNVTVGGGYVVQSGEASLVHGMALTTDTVQIGNIVLAAHDGVPIRVRDVADVQLGAEIRRGGVTAGGTGETVLGLGFMLLGENSHAVTRRLEERMNEIRKSLPAGVDVQLVYKRTELVDRVIATVERNLCEGALLVVAVLFVFLGNLRAGLIVALAIPLAMLFSFSAMLSCGIAASLLSLGAIDFGLIVDSSVILVENSVRRLRQATAGAQSVIAVVRDAALEVRRPTMFGELIIMIVYLPILLLEGVEGKLFRPMALTVIFALLSSLVFSLTLTPVLCSLLLRPRAKERENVTVRAAQWLYRPFVRLALNRPGLVCAVAAILIAGGAYLATRLGSSFIPRLYEEAIVINTVRLAGISLEESLRYSTQIEKIILEKYPQEVQHVWSRTGSAQVATDPMGLELTDIYLTLTPRAQWTRAKTQAELTNLMAKELASLPAMRMVFTQPIEMRMNEMVAGSRADIGVKIFGDDLEQLRTSAAEVETVLRSIPGSADVSAEQITGQPVLEVHVDQDALARYGVPASQVLDLVQAVGGTKAGEAREEQRRFDLVIKLAESYRQDASALGRIIVPTASGERIPLTSLAHIRQTEGPSTLTREGQKRRIVVQCNVRGRDLGGFVAEARRRIAEAVQLPPGYYVGFGGQFEHLQRARTRLLIIVPLALASIFVLLRFSTGNTRDALLVLTAAPFAAVGGVAALWLSRMDFTISAGVGFVAVCGVATLAGLVLASAIRQGLTAGLPLLEAIEQGALVRLRPILMTGLVAALGFIPMALNTGVGAEVQRPLAVVVIGGVITANVLALLILPALYALFGGRQPRVGGRGIICVLKSI
jgi:cobalt-zinc-cadmium resistance protein CzcA